MLYAILAISGLILILGIVIVIILLKKRSEFTDLSRSLDKVQTDLDAFDRYLRDDLQRLRGDLTNSQSETRKELNASLGQLNESLSKENRSNREETTAALTKLNQQINADAGKNREELSQALNNLSESLARKLQELTKTEQTQFETLKTALENRMEQIRTNNETKLEEVRKTVDEKLHEIIESLNKENRSNREETTAALTKLNQQINADAGKNREELSQALNNLSESLARKLQELTKTEQTQFETLKTALENRMEQIRTNNETKLEEMRKTVDEKLHETLEKRLGDSFKQVSERLELVHKGLGEMQNLANGVGDLKKVLSNVKTRGVMGEIQLEMILEQMLTPEQYVRNYKPHKRRDETVEFAIRLPGRDEDLESVYLPMDAKFPIEDYHRLIEAWDKGDNVAIDAARKGLQSRIIECARDIKNKYINPPYTTDFALLFLPVEGLYAEVLRDPDLFETIRRKYQVIVVGPTTVSAILNSLQMGFRTLAIEKRTGEVWRILSAVKNEFGKFGKILEKTQKKLQEASNSIETASHRSRQIEKKLNKVQELPDEEPKPLLETGEGVQIPEDDGDQEDEDLT